MARRMCCCAVVLGVVLAGCGGSTKTSSSPTTSSTVATTTTVARTTTSAPVDYGKTYLALVKPLNAAGDAFNAAIGKLGNNPTSASVQTVATPFAEVLSTFDSKVLRVGWPATTAADVKGLVTADGALIGDLASARSQTVLSASSWESALSSDASKSATAANIVRADLGLAPPK